MARLTVDGGKVEIAADMADGPACRVCGCTENSPCEGGCQWVPDPHGGDVCSAHFVPAADLGPGALVRSTEWAGGDLVRIISVTALPSGRVAVCYQDAAARVPGTLAHVDPGFLVLPEGGDAR